MNVPERNWQDFVIFSLCFSFSFFSVSHCPNDKVIASSWLSYLRSELYGSVI